MSRLQRLYIVLLALATFVLVIAVFNMNETFHASEVRVPKHVLDEWMHLTDIALAAATIASVTLIYVIEMLLLNGIEFIVGVLKNLYKKAKSNRQAKHDVVWIILHYKSRQGY